VRGLTGTASSVALERFAGDASNHPFRARWPDALEMPQEI
jgi:hypothetical protein